MLNDISTSSLGRHWPALLASMLWLAGPCAKATPAYRCDLRGEVRYQQQACEGGRAVEAPDERTKAQQQHTLQATATAAKLGKQLERERRHQEKASKGQGPIAMDSPDRQPKWSSPSTQGQTLKRERPFTAKVPKDKGSSVKSS
ncbi:hypothetical protein [Aquabacterium sp.]|uniref:hypothetical protein n=1 Tax=Aquabacterium sp. TaxID=1872578 RepID=UPI00248972B7|nr:hypothetical protein [Aquabacterium sp.]MDI1261089.1 hypothetical protein [Aquabacterium sp.]